MKICIAQQNYIIGDFGYNTAKIKTAITAAREQGAALVVFSELAVCGYPPRDFLDFDEFIESCEQAIDDIRQHSSGIAVLVGAPSRNPKPEGKNLFNSAYFIEDGEIRQVIHKTLLPNYDIFDEYRYFEPADQWGCVDFKGKKLAVTICEDIWDLVEDPLYRVIPMRILTTEKPDMMINLSASPFDYTHAEDRLATAKRNVQAYNIPLVYCNTVGAQTEIVFDGGSLVLDAEANLIRECSYFQECLCAFDWEDGKIAQPIQKPAQQLPNQESDPETLEAELNIDRIGDALIQGIREYFSKMNLSKAIVASSGGIDSALVLALACKALGPENVQALLLPSPFSTGHSVDDAVALSKNLGNPYTIISISDIYAAANDSLEPLFKGLPFNVAEENLQSRIRGLLVMAVSNKFGSILLNTSNKSELACGYGTLYGDMAGGLGILGDLYKTQVYALARHLNREAPLIPEHILVKPPSAELRPGQKDSDSLPDYPVLDAILYQYIERRQGPKAIKAQGFEPALVDRVLALVNKNEYKRSQFCPVIRISPKAFGIGRRMPVVAKYLS